jgi:hypothetical protein
LVIHHEIRTGDGRGWSFRDPSLTTWEARELTSWLGNAITDSVAPQRKASDGQSRLSFTEPVIGFDLQHRWPTSSRIHAQFVLEGRSLGHRRTLRTLAEQYSVAFDDPRSPDSSSR